MGLGEGLAPPTRPRPALSGPAPQLTARASRRPRARAWASRVLASREPGRTQILPGKIVPVARPSKLTQYVFPPRKQGASEGESRYRGTRCHRQRGDPEGLALGALSLALLGPIAAVPSPVLPSANLPQEANRAETPTRRGPHLSWGPHMPGRAGGTTYTSQGRPQNSSPARGHSWLSKPRPDGGIRGAKSLLLNAQNENGPQREAAQADSRSLHRAARVTFFRDTKTREAKGTMGKSLLTNCSGPQRSRP